MIKIGEDVKKIVEKVQKIVKNRIILVIIGLINLICLAIIITAVGVGSFDIIFPVGSALIIAVPMVVTFVAVFLMKLIFSSVFNWGMSNHTIYTPDSNSKITDLDPLIVTANGEVTGIIQAIERGRIYTRERKIPFLTIVVGIIAALIGTFKVGVGFAVSTTTLPGILSINGGKFYSDPLTVPSCKVGIDGGCPEFFQDRFRFKWTQRASDVLINGISKQLSANWGDVVDGRVIMVATTDNDTSKTYNLVQAENKSIPAFSLTTTYSSSKYLDSLTFRNLNITATQPLLPLLQAVQAESGLEGRWMAEVMNLEQDTLNETTRITVNLIQITALNASCDGIPVEAGNFLMCRPTKGINLKCFMRTYVEYANSIKAGCKTCETKGVGNNDIGEEYSSPKPVYGEFMHGALAYGGYILIPRCTDDSVGGCLTPTNSVDQVRDKFVELLRGITASGVLARRNLLSEMGKEIPIQILVKGTTGVRLDVGKGYWITNLVMCILCFIGVVDWHYRLKNEDFRYENDQVTCEWLLKDQTAINKHKQD